MACCAPQWAAPPGFPLLRALSEITWRRWERTSLCKDSSYECRGPAFSVALVHRAAQGLYCLSEGGCLCFTWLVSCSCQDLSFASSHCVTKIGNLLSCDVSLSLWPLLWFLASPGIQGWSLLFLPDSDISLGIPVSFLENGVLKPRASILTTNRVPWLLVSLAKAFNVSLVCISHIGSALHFRRLGPLSAGQRFISQHLVFVNPSSRSPGENPVTVTPRERHARAAWPSKPTLSSPRLRANSSLHRRLLLLWALAWRLFVPSKALGWPSPRNFKFVVLLGWNAQLSPPPNSFFFDIGQRTNESRYRSPHVSTGLLSMVSVTPIVCMVSAPCQIPDKGEPPSEECAVRRSVAAQG